MELQFKKESLSWLECPVREVRNLEQTQEMKLTDGMPDVGRVLAAWGQPILRGKEWNSGSFGFSGGMTVWVLYAPEDGSTVRCVEGWIPCQMQWDLPSGTPEGQIRVSLRPRFVDARSVSPRKIMVRAGFSALGEGFAPCEEDVFIPEEVPESVQLLVRTYPVRMCMEAGEKTFRLDEELTMPSSCPVPAKLICGMLTPAVEEHRVLGNRLVFRGSANLHVLYMSEEGQVFSWDFPVSISQFSDLKGSYGNDAYGTFSLAVTDLELELDDECHFRMKCGMTAQYTVEDVCEIRTVEDAYSPMRELDTEQTILSVPAVLEDAQRKLTVRQQIHQEANIVTDVSFLPDFSRQRRNGNTLELEQPGIVQVLYYTPEGSLQASTAHWEGKLQMDIHEDAQMHTVLQGIAEPRAEISAESIQVSADLLLRCQSTTRQVLNSVSAMKIGEEREPDPGRPSLVLCRAGGNSLWQIARENGSTMDAIRRATGFEGEPDPEQMLLIPVV